MNAMESGTTSPPKDIVRAGATLIRTCSSSTDPSEFDAELTPPHPAPADPDEEEHRHGSRHGDVRGDVTT